LGAGTRVQTLATKPERTFECDCHGEIPRGFRLHAKNLAASAELYAGVGPVRSPDRDLYCGTLGNQKRARKQNAPETDVLRAGVHFLVSQLDRDRQVERVANVTSFLPLRGGHSGHGLLGKSTPKLALVDR